MADPGGLNSMFMQIGQLVGSMSALHEKIDNRGVAADKQSDLVQAELRTIKHDLRELEQKHDAALHALSSDASLIKKTQTDTAQALMDLRKPVDEIMTLRAKATGIFLTLGPIGAAALYFIPELWKALYRLLDAALRGRGP
jgi:hypothetical protein